ncbi:MAG: GNAT family N-acetyltransferase [Pyrinomonadaceae bacterium]
MQNAGQIEIRLLREADIPAALQLKELARWNQTESDWRRLLRLEPSGCFCATVQGRVVGTTTTTTYGRDLAWIGMVLVDPDYRRLGIATRIMHVALDYLTEAGVLTVKLDATPDGRPVYEKLGFKVESLVERWTGVAEGLASDCRAIGLSAIDEALVFDRRAFIADRSQLIEMLVEDVYVPPLVTRSRNDRLTGYALTRRGTAAAYIGPLVATTPDAATSLVDGMCNQLAGQRLYIDLNTDFETGREVLTARGFVKQRDLIRMCYGETSEAGTSPSIFAIAGPEYG